MTNTGNDTSGTFANYVKQKKHDTPRHVRQFCKHNKNIDTASHCWELCQGEKGYFRTLLAILYIQKNIDTSAHCWQSGQKKYP